MKDSTTTTMKLTIRRGFFAAVYLYLSALSLAPAFAQTALVFAVNGTPFDVSDGFMVSESAGSATYQVKLRTPPHGTERVVVDLAYSGDSDMSISLSQLTFTAGGDGSGTGDNGNWDVYQAVRVAIATDTDAVAGTGTVTHRVANDGTNGNYDNFEAGVTVTEADGHTVQVVITPTSLTVAENAGVGSYRVDLGTAPTGTVVIDMVSSNTANATVSPTQLSFAAVADPNATPPVYRWDDAPAVTVTGVDDFNSTVLPRTASIQHAIDTLNTTASEYAAITNIDTVAVTVTTGGAGGNSSTRAAHSASSWVVSAIPVFNDGQVISTIYPLDVTLFEGEGEVTNAYSIPIYIPFSGTEPIDQIITVTSDNPDVVINNSPITFDGTELVARYANNSYPFFMPLDVTVRDESFGGGTDDTVDDTVTLTFTKAFSGAGAEYSTEFKGTLTVIDNDIPQLVLPSGSITVDEGSMSNLYNLTLSHTPTTDVTVTIESLDSSCGMATIDGGMSATFAMTGWSPSTALPIVFTASRDNIHLFERTPCEFRLRASGGIYAGMTRVVTPNIINTDVAGVTVNVTGGTSITEDRGTTTYTLSLDTIPQGDVEIDITGVVGVVTVAPVSVTFTTGDYGPKNITVTGVPDDVQNAGGSRSANITHRINKISTNSIVYDNLATYNVNNNPLDSVTITVADDDTPGFTTSTLTLSPPSISENNSSGTYTVRTDSVPSADIEIVVSGFDSNLLSVEPSRFTLNATTRDQMVTVTALTDNIVMLRSDITLTHAITTTATGYTSLSGAQALGSVVVMIGDDDMRGMVLTDTAVTTAAIPDNVSRTADITTLIPGEAVLDAYHLRLNSQPTSTVTIRTTSSDSAQVKVRAADSSGPFSDFIDLSFTSTNWYLSQDVDLMATINSTNLTDLSMTNTASGGGYGNGNAMGVAMITINTIDLTEAVTMILPELARALSGHTTAAIAERAGRALVDNTRQVRIGGASTFSDAVMHFAPGLADGTYSYKQLLGDTEFVLPLHKTGTGRKGTNNNSSNATGGGFSLWGGVDYLDMSAHENQMVWDGDFVSAYLGIDTMLSSGDVLGVALTHSFSEVAFEGGEAGTGVQELTLNSLHPYWGWSTGWLTMGYGTGELTLTPTDHRPKAYDVTMETVGFGLDGELGQPQRVQLRLKGELSHTRMSVEDFLRQPDGTLAPLSIEGQRVRVSIEGSRAYQRGQAQFTPTFEAGVRHHAGDGLKGTGLELSTGVRYLDATGRFTAEADVHALVGREEYEEWGISGSVRYTSPGGRGLSLHIEPTWGNTQNTISAMWNKVGDSSYYDRTVTPAVGSLNVRVDYGFGRHGALITPYHEFSLTEQGGNNRYQFGIRWELPGANIELSSEQQNLTSGQYQNNIRLQGRIRF